MATRRACPDCRKRSVIQTSEDRGPMTTYRCTHSRCGTLWTQIALRIAKEIASMKEDD